MLDILLISAGILLITIGIIGSVVPILPGPPIAYGGLLLVQFSSKQPFSTEFLVIFGALAILSAMIDNVLPIYATKKFNGSKKGGWGSAIGLIFGIILFPPLGIILGPIIGAFVGEMINGQSSKQAVKPAVGSFIGFLSSIFLRLILSIVMAYFFVTQVFFN